MNVEEQNSFMDEAGQAIRKRYTPSYEDPSTQDQFPVESQICHPPQMMLISAQIEPVTLQNTLFIHQPR